MKKDVLLEYFYNHSVAPVHFEELLQRIDISRPLLSRYLNQLIKQKIIIRIKKKGAHPYYRANYTHSKYLIEKRLFMLRKLEDIGLLSYLGGLEAYTVVLFGSASNIGWYKGSDIDIFVYGPIKDLETWSFEQKLSKTLDIFLVKNEKELKKFDPSLLSSVRDGFLIKGSMSHITPCGRKNQFIKPVIHKRATL